MKIIAANYSVQCYWITVIMDSNMEPVFCIIVYAAEHTMVH